jgi:hypothetical protein
MIATMINPRRIAAAFMTFAMIGAAACSDSTGPASRTATGAASADRGAGVDDNNNRHGGANGGGQDNNGNNGNNDNNDNNAQRVRTILRLTAPATNAAFAGASGKAQFDTRPGENELEMEVEHVPAGTVVNFFVDDTKVGTATVGTLRETEINLNSRVGDVIPAITGGTAVSVRTAAGAVIASGTF